MGWVLLGLAVVAEAKTPDPSPDAEPVPAVSGDVAITYGRNFGQGLDVAGWAAELKANVHPQVALGLRVGGGLGVGFGPSSLRGYLGAPVLAKAEGFLGQRRVRAFVGLGAGVTWVAAAGARASATDLTAEAYTVTGLLPTVMPEVGVDLGRFRASVAWSALARGGRGGGARLGTAGLETGSEVVPSLSGATLQVGGHFGGIREQAAPAPAGVDATVR